MTKHSILKQTSEGLVIDLYFSDRPKCDLHDGVKNPICESSKTLEKEWLSHPDNTVKVDEGSKEKILDYAAHSMGKKLKKWITPYSIIFTKELQQGIEIPADVFEVRQFPYICAVCELDESSTCHQDPQCKIELAFFKEEKKEQGFAAHVSKTFPTLNALSKKMFDKKEEKEETQEDLWGEIEKDLLDVDISSDESEKCLLRWKQNFEIKRRKG